MSDELHLPEIDLRSAQDCPGWCVGEDHVKAQEEIEGTPAEAEHFRYAASLGGLSVEITQPLYPLQGALISLHFGRRNSVKGMSSIEARAAAAWLLKAADLVDYEA